MASGHKLGQVFGDDGFVIDARAPFRLGFALLDQLCAAGIVRPTPTFFMVERVAQGVERRLPTRWSNVQGFAGREFDPGGDHVNMHVSITFPMDHGAKIILIFFETRKSGALEVVEHGADFGVGGLVFKRESDHARCIPVDRGQAVDQFGG